MTLRRSFPLHRHEPLPRAVEILAHRGLWQQSDEANSLKALVSAAAEGFGIEFDVRDSRGQVVVAHDPPRGGDLLLEEMMSELPESVGTLAVNIKSDGIAPEVVAALAGRSWFAFDMSAPQSLAYLSHGAPVYARVSDVEPEPILVDEASGLWVDALRGEWLTHDHFLALSALGLPLALVSPELHGREHGNLWQVLAELGGSVPILLCTDRAHEAREFFGARS
jgi:glycerophosphoryl diester phosphodiesterase